MIVKSRKDAVIAQGETWKSERLLLKKDNMGFSFHITTMKANTETRMHYKNHLESVYCIKGSAILTNVKTGVSYEINPGTIYALDQHDEHILTTKTEVEFACVFNPPCSGNEQHREDGSYPLD